MLDSEHAEAELHKTQREKLSLYLMSPAGHARIAIVERKEIIGVAMWTGILKTLKEDPYLSEKIAAGKLKLHLVNPTEVNRKFYAFLENEMKSRPEVVEDALNGDGDYVFLFYILINGIARDMSISSCEQLFLISTKKELMHMIPGLKID